MMNACHGNTSGSCGVYVAAFETLVGNPDLRNANNPSHRGEHLEVDGGAEIAPDRLRPLVLTGPHLP